MIIRRLSRLSILVFLLAACTALKSSTQLINTPPTASELKPTPSPTQSVQMVTTMVMRSPTPTSEKQISPVPPTNIPTTEKIPPEALYFYNYEETTYRYIYPINRFEDSKVLGQDVVVFSHFSNKLLQIVETVQQEFWISDLLQQKLIKMPENQRLSCPSNYWYWSADDRYLICDADVTTAGSIFNVNTGRIEPWPYICNAVAISPRSGHLATWCSSPDQSGLYAVLEWGNEIWNSTSPPTSFLVQTNAIVPDSLNLWGWSSDGKLFAFFNTTGEFVIVQQDGTISLTMASARDWSAKYTFQPNSNAIQWSANSERVLVYMNGADKECTTQEASDTEITDVPPCWQVIDIKSGKVIWQLSSYLEQSINKDAVDYRSASISSNGRFLALASAHFSQEELVIIDIYTNTVLWSYFYADKMRWGTFLH